MQLNHIGFNVTDVLGTVNMFETYFGLVRAPRTPCNAKMAFLTDDRGALLTFFKSDDSTYPGLFHIGFMQEHVEQVNAIHEKLKAGGFDPEEIREEHGRTTFYFKAPGGFVVEVNSLLEEARPELKSKISEN